MSSWWNIGRSHAVIISGRAIASSSRAAGSRLAASAARGYRNPASSSNFLRYSSVPGDPAPPGGLVMHAYSGLLMERPSIGCRATALVAGMRYVRMCWG